MRPPRRADVWLADLDKVRPVIVLTRDPMGRFLNAVIAAPVTSTVRGVTTEVAVGPADGIRLPSVANLDQIQLVALSRLIRPVGRARPQTMTALCDALAVAVSCERG
ncbi:MAG: type II toxin-antitoxin system PemK/MazF family toxin [Actinobacteria bacterium]|nr:type II toxin-antitoxin system PemK/MazF family toxin [Actinomycetota bacterium]